MKKSYEIDMIRGPLVRNVLIYAFPLMLSGILQLLFNAADVIVVGRFAGPQALAAVGSTGSLTGLLTNLFIGLSIGTNVLVARYYGAQNYESIKETIDTSIIAAFFRRSYPCSCRAFCIPSYAYTYGHTAGRYRPFGALYENLVRRYAIPDAL